MLDIIEPSQLEMGDQIGEGATAGNYILMF